jgi:hypothetical protein
MAIQIQKGSLDMGAMGAKGTISTNYIRGRDHARVRIETGEITALTDLTAQSTKQILFRGNWLFVLSFLLARPSTRA